MLRNRQQKHTANPLPATLKKDITNIRLYKRHGQKKSAKLFGYSFAKCKRATQYIFKLRHVAHLHFAPPTHPFLTVENLTINLTEFFITFDKISQLNG